MVRTLVENILMPLIGVFMGGVNFQELSIKVGDAAIGYGAFIQAMIDFVIIAFVVFMMLKAINKMKESAAKEEAAAEPEADPADVALLTEIRYLLKKGQ